LRAEISRRAARATADVVRAALDEPTQQQLIDGFIAKVGAGK